MFTSCNNLVGGDGKKFDSSKTDKTYAKPDRNGASGYFTYKPAPGAADDKCTLKYNSNYNGGKELTFSQVVKQGNSFTADGQGNQASTEANALRTDDYSVFGWNTQKDGKGTHYDIGQQVNITGKTITLYAEWEKTPHLFYGISEGVLYISPVKTTLAQTQNDATLKSTGTGSIPWYSSRSAIEKVQIVVGSNNERLKPESMRDWFYEISATSILGLSNIDTTKFTTMQETFCRCGQLTSLDLTGFDTSHVTNMGGAFSRLSKLENLDLSMLNTSKVTNMRYLMDNCTVLKTLNISNWNLSSLSDSSYMFESCSALTTIYANDKVDFSKVGTSSYMFRNCSSLVGGNGTTYSSSYIDKTYARIDKSGTPGYFTNK